MVLVVPQGEPGVRVEGFVTSQDGRPATATRATVKWDDTALTVIVDCADTNILALHAERDDVEMWRDDYVEVFLDIGHTHEDGWLRILVSASGGICDARGRSPVYDACGGDLRYRLLGLLPQTKAERTDNGWRATLVMPWKGIGKKPQPGDVWGFNLHRENQPEHEYSCWTPTPRGTANVHMWGHLVFAEPTADGVASRLSGGAAAVNSNTLAEVARKHSEVPRIIEARAGRERKSLVAPHGGPGVPVDQFVTPRNAAAQAATVAMVTWDESALTVTFDCADTNILAIHAERDDVEMSRDDCVEVFLDIGHTHDDGWLHVLVSASGGLYDAQGSSPEYDVSGGDLRYQMPGLKTHVERMTSGWRATLVMPWEGIGTKPQAGDVWGFNLNRENHPEGEYLGWAPTPGGFTDVHEWGHMVFAPPVGAGGATGVDGDTLAAILRKHGEVPRIVKARLSRERSLAISKRERRPLDGNVTALVSSKRRGHTLWREEWVRRARSNAVHAAWGKAIAGRILEVADYWAAKTDQELLDLVPAGNPRACTPGQYYGDPISGGSYRTLLTCLETPNRWYNPTTKQWWYDGVTVANPGTGEKVVVKDDGSGFIAPDGFPRPGVRTYFTAAYRGFLIGMLIDFPYAGRMGGIPPEVFPGSSGVRYSGAAPRLAEAYALTGDVKYARKAAILLGRLAELYPYMNGNMEDDPRYVPGDGSAWLEKSTTDSEHLRSFLDAVDLVWDAADANMERQLAGLFAAVPGPDGLPRQEPFRWKQALNAMMPYAAQLCEKSRLDTWADWSLRWINTEIAVAACTESPNLMAKVLLGPPPALQGQLQDVFRRDGRHGYDSAGYLDVMARSFLTLPVRSVGFQGGREFPAPLNLYDDPRFRLEEIIAYNFKTETGALQPTFGDGSSGRNPRPPPESALAGYLPYDPALEVPAAFSERCRSLFQSSVQGRSLDFLREKHGDFMTLIFAPSSTDPAGPTGTMALGSSVLEDSATAYLRSGQTPPTRHDLVMWGVETTGHGHGDKLGIWFAGRGRNLAAAGGGYFFSQCDPKAQDWESHSAACWVVLVDGMGQRASSSGLLAFYAGDLFRLCALVNTNSYPGSRQQRTGWLIPGPQDGDAYVVDIFQVAGGGKCFDYNTRGNDAGRFEDIRFDFRSGTPAWESRSGTLAGTNVPLYRTPGYGWMKDVRMTPVERDFAWQYDYGGAGLKVHALSFGRPRTLIYALGEVGGFARGQSPWDPHVLWRDEATGASNHVTQFVTVLESVGAAPFIRTIQALSCSEPATGIHSVGIKLTHVSGHADVILINPQPGRKVGFTDPAGGRWETDAATAMQRLDAAGRVMRTELFDGTFLKAPQGEYACPASLEGLVETVDYESREIVVRLATAASTNTPPQALEERVGILYPASGGRLSAYRIKSPALAGTRFSFVSPLPLAHFNAALAEDRRSGDVAVRPAREPEKQKAPVYVAPGDRFRLPLAARFDN
jgi:hypothetical protein